MSDIVPYPVLGRLRDGIGARLGLLHLRDDLGLGLVRVEALGLRVGGALALETEGAASASLRADLRCGMTVDCLTPVMRKRCVPSSRGGGGNIGFVMAGSGDMLLCLDGTTPRDVAEI